MVMYVEFREPITTLIREIQSLNKDMETLTSEERLILIKKIETRLLKLGVLIYEQYPYDLSKEDSCL